jgi:thioredoxin-related protein
MKKIFFSFVLFFTSLFGDVKFTDIFDAYDVAAAQEKPVLVMLSKEGCQGCEYMHNVVYKNSKVSEYINKHFVAVNIDVYAESVPEELEYFATPTFYVLDKDENILKRINGGQKTDAFLETLQGIAEGLQK